MDLETAKGLLGKRVKLENVETIDFDLKKDEFVKKRRNIFGKLDFIGPRKLDGELTATISRTPYQLDNINQLKEIT